MARNVENTPDLGSRAPKSAVWVRHGAGRRLTRVGFLNNPGISRAPKPGTSRLFATQGGTFT